MQTNGEGKQEAELIRTKGQKVLDLIQICLRASALGTSVAATWVIFTSNQTALVYGITMDAKYSFSSAIKFFALANAIASVFALLSLGLTFFLWKHKLKANYNMFFFMHDLAMMSLLLAGCSAASAIGYVGKFGNSHAGWMPICDYFHSFCHKMIAAVILGYLSLICFLCLTIISAAKSTSQISPVQLQNF